MNLKSMEDFPKEIFPVIEGIVSVLNHHCSEIFLYGSGACNNLSYNKNADGTIEFYSDLEFIVVPNDKEMENNKSFNKKMVEDISSFLKNSKLLSKPLFVDVRSVSKDFFTDSELRICTFELKNNAICLKGNNYLDLLPIIDKNNYQPSIQNIEIVKGLKILLLESNKYLLKTDETTNANIIQYKYFLFSSMLNILRTLLPFFDIFESKVQDRIMKFQSIQSNEELNKYFSKEIIDNFFIIFKKKEEKDFDVNVKKLFLLVYRAYKALLCFILKCNEKDLFLEIENKGKTIFSGGDEKISMLIKLTNFFLGALDCLEQLSDKSTIEDSKVNVCRNNYNELINCKNSFELMNIIDSYEDMERNRWKIIGSKA